MIVTKRESMAYLNTVPVDIGILLLYIYNYAHLVFNEIT